MEQQTLIVDGKVQPANGTALQIATPPPTPMSALMLAIEKGADINTIERLVSLQEKMLSREAEIEFNAAMNRAQGGMTAVRTNAENSQTHSRYATYSAVDKAIRPIYTREGFSLSFDTEPSETPDVVQVICYVSHVAGHTRTYSVPMPSDGKGAKGGDVMTKTHATGAAMAYGMRYLLKFIFNIAVGEDDNDGNQVDKGWLDERLEWIANSRNAEEVVKVFQEAYKEAQKKKDTAAMASLITAKNARKKELL